MTRRRRYVPSSAGGPGTVLKRLLARMGFTAGLNATCECEKTTARMDRRGPDWCETHMDWVVQRMKFNAKALGYRFFSKTAARAVAWLAIQISRGQVAEDDVDTGAMEKFAGDRAGEA